MSLQIPVQKDIGSYEQKIVGRMGLRTLLCVAGGFASAVLAACIAFFGLGIQVGDATLPVMAAALPFWLAGFWRPFGMKAEVFLPLFLDHALNDQMLTYRTAQAEGHLPGTGPQAGRPSRKAKRALRRKGFENREPSKEQ